MRRLLVHLLALVALGVWVAPAAAQGPAIDWTMPDRLGPDFDGDGLIDYANSAEEFEGLEADFTVDLAVRADLCRDDVTYVWRSAAGTVTRKGREGCRVRQRFEQEGTYPVSLQVRDGDGRVASYNRDIEVQDWLVVSIGDSVGSGEGNPEAGGLFGKAVWQSARCHRSSLAASAKAALALEASDPHTSTTFVHLACSGAEIGVGLLRPYRGIDPPEESTPLPPQVKELERIGATRSVDAVMVNIGANDVSFGPMVAFCIRHPNCVKKPFDPSDPESSTIGRPTLEQAVASALGRLSGGYAELADRLAGVVEPQRTMIVDYFDPTRDEEGHFCRIGLPDPLFRSFQIDPDEAEFAATKLLAPLNREITKAASAAGWTEVTGVAEAYRTHGYCAEEPWIRHFLRSFFSQRGNRLFSRVAGALHPNEDGHRETALLLGGALQRVLGQSEQLAPTTDEVAIDELAITVDPPEDSDSEGEGDAETMALIVVLPVMGLLAMLAVAGLLRLLGGPRTAPPFENLQAETIDAPLPTWPAPDSVAAFGWMLEASAEDASVHWVHRRVESIEILDESLVRRRVSVDFTPESPRGVPTHAPIALLAKRTLTGFDLRDEAGASVPLLTREQNAAFSTAHMLTIAREAARTKGLSEELPEELVRLCWRIAKGEPHEANGAIYEIATELEPKALRDALTESARFRQATTTFADSFPVIVAVADPARRRVVKLAYNHVLVGSGPTRRQRLGIDPILLWFEIPELGDASSRHIEFLKADGLEAFNPQLVGLAPDGTYIASEGSEEGGEPHLAVVDAPRGSRGGAGISLRAARAGILVGGPLLAALSAAALTAAWFALPQLAGETAGSAASILLAVPAALGAYLSARQPHPLEAALLAGPRALVFLSGMLAFFGAAALALDSSVEPLRFIIGGLALASWLPVVGLTLTYFLPPGPPGEDDGGVL